MVLMKKSLPSSSMEENFENLSLLFLLLCRRLQVEREGGEISNKMVALLTGISTGAVPIILLELSSSSTALLTAIALLAKSSKSWILNCLLRLVGVCSVLLEPPLQPKDDPELARHQV